MVAEMVAIVKRAEDASKASETREAKMARWRRPSKAD